MDPNVLDRHQCAQDTRAEEPGPTPSAPQGISTAQLPAKGSGKRSPDRRKKKAKAKKSRQNATRSSSSRSAVRQSAKEKEKDAESAPAAAPEQKHLQKKAKSRGDFPRTDAGNAELFAALYEKSLRFDHKRKRWLRWSQHWWLEDKMDVVMQFAKNAARHRLRVSVDIEDEAARKQEVKWALISESRARLEAMVVLAQTEDPLRDTGENWDRDPWLLGVANGVVDLRTGKLRHGKPEDRITTHTNVPFNTEAKCEGWLRFLDQIFGKDGKLIDYIKRCLGYSLTGLTREHCLFYLWGSGANGKTTLLEVIRRVLGPYAGAAPFSMFEHKNKAAIPSDVARTAGKRLITASETDESMRLNESRIKAMTGGDKQTARFMYKDWFEFDSTAKIWLAFNHKPEIQDDSPGMWRRVRLIPFNRRFEDNEQDKKLTEKLIAEAEGILAWCVRGSLEWQKVGLNEPASVNEATAQYRQESDTFGNFIAECCEVGEEFSVSSSDLWKAYEEWADERGVAKLDRRKFANRLKSRGFMPNQVGHQRTRGWSGIKLKSVDGASGRPEERTEADVSRMSEKDASAFKCLIPS